MASAHVKQTPMCANSRIGRACRRLRMSLSGLWLHHGLRGGCAAREPEAVTGATPLFRCPAWHLGGLGCARHPNPPRGRSGPAVPLREGQTASRDGARPGLGRRCRTARRPTGRPTRPPPPRSGARHPSGNGLRASIRFSGAILQRQDIAVCPAEAENRGYSSPPGVEFVRHRRFCGLGFRPITPKNAENRCESGFPGSTRAKGHPVGQRLLRADPRAPARHDQAPGWPVHRGSRRPERRARRGSARSRRRG